MTITVTASKAGHDIIIKNDYKRGSRHKLRREVERVIAETGRRGKAQSDSRRDAGANDVMCSTDAVPAPKQAMRIDADRPEGSWLARSGLAPTQREGAADGSTAWRMTSWPVFRHITSERLDRRSEAVWWCDDTNSSEVKQSVIIHSLPLRFCLPGQFTSGCTTRMCRVSASLREKVFSSVHKWHRTFCFFALWIVSSCLVRS